MRCDASPAEAHHSDVFDPTLLLQEPQHCIHFSAHTSQKSDFDMLESNPGVPLLHSDLHNSDDTGSCTGLCLLAFCLLASPGMWTSRRTGSTAPFQHKNLDICHCTQQETGIVFRGKMMAAHYLAAITCFLFPYMYPLAASRSAMYLVLGSCHPKMSWMTMTALSDGELGLTT